MAIYQPSKDVILAAINAQNSIAVKATDIVYSAPKDIRGTDKGNTTKKNTQVKVTADGVVGSTWSGKKNVFYDRLQIQDLVVLIGDTLYIGPSNNHLQEAIPALNLRYGFVFEAGDLQEAEILWNEDKTAGTVKVKAVETSLGWIGEYNFKVAKGDESLPSKVSTNTLSGLKYPNGQMGSETVAATIAQVYSYPFNFTVYHDLFKSFTPGVLTGDALTNFVNAMKVITGGSWVTTNNATWGLSGAEVTFVGDNDAVTMPTNSKYSFVLAVKLPASLTAMVGTMYLQFNKPEDPNEV
ncbi:virion structural protein [Erwinia phage phiEaH2]|uniref:Putative virion structural protein n=1 Tax=Erwinia phage phiEaH2 TaxID=1029988 RepID=J7KDY7_9CAUD|nr:virion structural protein [Erwinia phage phiEaH2]AFQ96609.1 putative virion structural protein [Erwinia phage phiEaH2]